MSKKFKIQMKKMRIKRNPLFWDVATVLDVDVLL